MCLYDIVLSIEQSRYLLLENIAQFVSSKAKGWISERVFQENNARQMIRG